MTKDTTSKPEEDASSSATRVVESCVLIDCSVANRFLPALAARARVAPY